MRTSALLTVGLALSALGSAAAQQPAGGAAAADAPTAGYRAEFLRELGDLETKFVRLAEQMPAEKYNWRPAEGVRSVGEVFLVRHAGEHLGQSIAYARVNGVVPPWTEDAQRQQQRRP